MKATVSHYSKANRPTTECRFVCPRDRARHVRYAYLRLRRYGMGPAAARHMVVLLVAAGQFATLEDAS